MEPKYVLMFDTRNYMTPYMIREQAVVSGKIASRPFQSFKHLEDALHQMSMLTGDAVLLAISLQPVDNTFDIRG